MILLVYYVPSGLHIYRIVQLKQTTMKPQLSSRIFSHFVYWISKFVTIAAIAMETWLSPKPTLVLYRTWVFAHYSLAQLLGNTAWWVDGWFHIFRRVREYVNMKIFSKSSIVTGSAWRLFCSVWRICLCFSCMKFVPLGEIVHLMMMSLYE